MATRAAITFAWNFSPVLSSPVLSPLCRRPIQDLRRHSNPYCIPEIATSPKMDRSIYSFHAIKRYCNHVCQHLCGWPGIVWWTQPYCRSCARPLLTIEEPQTALKHLRTFLSPDTHWLSAVARRCRSEQRALRTQPLQRTRYAHGQRKGMSIFHANDPNLIRARNYHDLWRLMSGLHGMGNLV